MEQLLSLVVKYRKTFITLFILAVLVVAWATGQIDFATLWDRLLEALGLADLAAPDGGAP